MQYTDCNGITIEVPVPTNVVVNTFDEDETETKIAADVEIENGQNAKIFEWKKKFNDKCKTISVPRLRPPTRKSQNQILSPGSPQMLNSDTFFQFPQFPKWTKSEK